MQFYGYCHYTMDKEGFQWQNFKTNSEIILDFLSGEAYNNLRS